MAGITETQKPRPRAHRRRPAGTPSHGPPSPAFGSALRQAVGYADHQPPRRPHRKRPIGDRVLEVPRRPHRWAFEDARTSVRGGGPGQAHRVCKAEGPPRLRPETRPPPVPTAPTGSEGPGCVLQGDNPARSSQTRGGGGAAGRGPSHARQPLGSPRRPCQRLFNLGPDLSILNNTAISGRHSPQLLQEINCVWLSQESRAAPAATGPRAALQRKAPALSPQTRLLMPV